MHKGLALIHQAAAKVEAVDESSPDANVLKSGASDFKAASKHFKDAMPILKGVITSSMQVKGSDAFRLRASEMVDILTVLVDQSDKIAEQFDRGEIPNSHNNFEISTAIFDFATRAKENAHGRRQRIKSNRMHLPAQSRAPAGHALRGF